MLQAAVSIIATIIVSLWLGGMIEQQLMRAEHLNINLRVVLAKFMRALFVLIGILITLPALGLDLTMLSVFGGALGVGVGLGLQKIASNYLSGFVILFDRSIRPGDLITVDQRYGIVSKFTARYIVLREMDGTEAIIPNDILVTTTVLNHSYSDTKLLIKIPVQVSYDSDVKQVMRILADIASRIPRVLKDPAPSVSLMRFGDSSIDFEIGVWLGDPEQGQAGVRSQVNEQIWEEFNRLGIKIPYPQRELTIKRDDSQK
jgi:small-conductance mechanosensitive channel